MFDRVAWIQQKRTALAILVMAAYVALAALIYSSLSNLANRAYLVWAEQTQTFAPLPDLFLNHAPSNQWTMHAANALPIVAVTSCILACLCARKIDILNFFCIAQALSYLFNAVAENVTVLPSSYGYHRCIDYLRITRAADLPVGPTLENLNLMGSCAAMIWSGHTVGTMLGTYYACRAANIAGACLPAALLAALVESALLIADAAHYTVDCYLSILLTTLLVTHPSFESFAMIVNPYVSRASVTPVPRETQKVKRRPLR